VEEFMMRNETTVILKEVRHQQIYNIIQSKKSVTVAFLVKTLYSSPTTIRRDLEILEKNGLLNRVHGGAVIAENSFTEMSQDFREFVNSDRKKIIANLIEQFLSNNQTLFLDGSSTNRYLVPIFKRFSNMIFITNSFKTVGDLTEIDSAEIYLAGGKIFKNFHNTNGNFTIDFLSNFKTDLAVIGCKGISADAGCTVISHDQSIIKRTMMKNAKIKVLLCDSSKFNNVYLFHFADFSDFDYIISDTKPTGKLLDAINRSSCKMIYKTEVEES
jgi:DeoR/GlpR family transcriptional regulator of sugar metabolism